MILPFLSFFFVGILPLLLFLLFPPVFLSSLHHSSFHLHLLHHIHFLSPLRSFSSSLTFCSLFPTTSTSHHTSSVTRSNIGVKAPLVRIDSQAKYAALSRGDGPLYLRFPHAGYREKILDHAVGSIIVTVIRQELRNIVKK